MTYIVSGGTLNPTHSLTVTAFQSYHNKQRYLTENKNNIMKVNWTKNILDCDQSNVLLVHIIFSCILLTAF